MDWFERPLYRWGAYILFTSFAFVIALLVTFPDGQVKRIAAVQIEHQLEKNMRSAYTVEVSDLDPWWLGIELEGVAIEQRSATRNAATDGETSGSAVGKASRKQKETPDQKGETNGANSGDAPSSTSQMKVEIPSIGARFAPLGSILNAGLSARYYLGLGGGSLSGSFTRASGAQYFALSVDSVDLEQSRLLEQLTGIPMFGRLDGYGSFTLAVDRPVVTDGSFEMTGEKITIGPKAKLKMDALPVGHVKVPQVNFGNLELNLQVDSEQEGRPTVELDQFRSKGRDLRLQIWGTMQLAGRIGRADTKLKSRIRFDQEFAQKNQPIQAMQRHRKFQNGQSGEWYGLFFWGPLNNLQWKGSPTAAKGPSEEDGGGKGGGEGKQPTGKGG